MSGYHCPDLLNPADAWLIPALLMLAGVSTRPFSMRRHSRRRAWLPALAGSALLILACRLPAWNGQAHPVAAQQQPVKARTGDVAAIMPLLRQRCAACHTAHPTMMAAAPQGLSFDVPANVQAHARDIYRQVWELKAMPLGNLTQMTDAERAAIARWYQSLGH